MVFDLMLSAAEEARIPYQILVATAPTPTDAKALQVSGGGMATGLVGIPLRYMHTPCEVIDFSDLENCIKLTVEYCRSLTKETSFNV
jgi:putative aminopeptidase FrvX